MTMNDPQIWTLIGVFSVAMIGVLTIITTSSHRVIRAELGGIDTRLTSRIEVLDERIGAKIEKLDARLTSRIDGLDERVTVISGRLDHLEGRFDNLEGRFDNLEGRFDNLEKRFDTLDREVGDIAKRFFRP
ncbi:MAG: hypothetical protein AAGC61_04890 [Microbacterium sp.]